MVGDEPVLSGSISFPFLVQSLNAVDVSLVPPLSYIRVVVCPSAGFVSLGERSRITVWLSSFFLGT